MKPHRQGATCEEIVSMRSGETVAALAHPQALDVQGQARTLAARIRSSRAAQGTRAGQGSPHGDGDGDSVRDLIEEGRS